MTEASRYIYTLIYPFTGPATNHCPENRLSHLQLMECPNVHIISLQLVTHHFYTNECWLIATELYKRIPILSSKEKKGLNPKYAIHTHTHTHTHTYIYTHILGFTEHPSSTSALGQPLSLLRWWTLPDPPGVLDLAYLVTSNQVEELCHTPFS